MLFQILLNAKITIYVNILYFSIILGQLKIKVALIATNSITNTTQAWTQKSWSNFDY